MNFFNLDLHISVIADIKWILERLGHNVTNWSISGHEWVFGRLPDKVDIVNQTTWKRIDQQMCNAFYERYRQELDQYDGFIVTHTPCFAMLFERWNKPIIAVASTRYEYPFTSDQRKWEEFNDFLCRKIDRGIVIPLANNKYDAAYAEYFTKRKWEVIPSLCAYTNIQYSGRRHTYLYSSQFKGITLPPGVLDKDQAFRGNLLSRLLQRIPGNNVKRGYSWSELADHRGIIHVPYNASVMSIFEQYTANIPLFFPSLGYLRVLYERHFRDGILSQLSYNQVDGLPPGSAIVMDGRDPNNYTNVAVMFDWTKLSDFYDADNMPYITYFDSFEELPKVLTASNLERTSQQMTTFNARRSERIFASWKKVPQRLP